MNLRGIQYVDINRSISATIQSETYPSYTTRIERDNSDDGLRYVVMEVTRSDVPPVRLSQNYQQATVIKARPVFPNSLLSTEVRVTPPPSDDAQQTESVNSLKLQSESNVLDVPTNNGLHYRLAEPLPGYLGALLYRAGKKMSLIFDNKTSLTMLDSSLILELQLQLNSGVLRSQHYPRITVQGFIDGENSQSGHLGTHTIDSLNVELYNLSHFCHRVNIIGKTNLVLCDSAGIAVDAIKSLVPAAFVSGVPVGFDNLQACITRYLQHGDYKRLLEDQQKALNDLLQHHCRDSFVMSNRDTLQSLIYRYVKRVKARDSIDSAENHKNLFMALDDLILSTQQTLCIKESSVVKLKSGLESSRRKFQKFKESPSRFMEDSQSKVLKSLIPGKS